MTSPHSNVPGGGPLFEPAMGPNGPSGGPSGGSTPLDTAELAAAYAAGTLSATEMDAFEARLIAGDADAVREFEAVQSLGRSLLLARAVPVAPPAIDLARITGAPPAPSANLGTLRLTDAPRTTGGRVAAWSGWIAAAAAITLAAVAWWPKLSGGLNGASTLSPTQLIAALEAKPGTAAADWSYWPPKGPDEAPEPGPGEPVAGADAVTGRVVWNTGQQDGWVTFRNLPANDPQKRQYQLWIIDKQQQYPIDGGTFDVAANGEVSVRLKPSVRVTEPVAVALTMEKPGGVVVPDQKRRVVVAVFKS